MRLVSFSVENYRSITQARKIVLGDRTVLVGANNEGKSNILRALNVAMFAIRMYPYRKIRGYRLPPGSARFGDESQAYDWARDIPVSVKKSKKEKFTKIDLEFNLNELELSEFKSRFKSALNGTLPVCITFDQSEFSVKIVKQGRGGASLNQKSDAIASYLAQKLQFQYIPAVRTAKSASAIVESIVSSELRQVENDPRYAAAIEAIRELQRPILKQYSEAITETLKSFVPGVKSVNFSVNDERRFQALRQSIDITVDDGVLTSLSAKGDGIQSLVALGLRRHALEDARLGGSYIFAIEEPEAHLHPDAVHELKDVLHDLSRVDQIIITTHSGSLANRDDLSSNVIVGKSRAEPAKSLAEIRKALGIRSYDNLVNSELVLLVEGDDDKLALAEVMKVRSAVVSTALETGRLSVESLGGASSLTARAAIFKGMFCNIHCFLDADDAGRNALDRAKRAGVVEESEYNLALIAGSAETEFEDLLNLNVYSGIVKSRFGIDLEIVRARNQKQKWSGRMHDIFFQSGKIFDDSTKQKLKLLIATAVADDPAGAIRSVHEGIITSLISTIEARLEVSKI